MKTDNELIAEFMGDKRKPYGLLWYNSSWNWLMPVVEKIAKLPECEKFELLPVRGECVLKIKMCGGFGWSKYDTLIEPTYKTVVKFIKWYNQTNCKHQWIQDLGNTSQCKKCGAVTYSYPQSEI